MQLGLGAYFKDKWFVSIFFFQKKKNLFLKEKFVLLLSLYKLKIPKTLEWFWTKFLKHWYYFGYVIELV